MAWDLFREMGLMRGNFTMDRGLGFSFEG